MSFNFTVALNLALQRCSVVIDSGTSCGLRYTFCNANNETIIIVKNFTEAEFVDYYCRYATLQVASTTNDIVGARLYILGSILGMLGYLLTLGVLIQRKFWLTSFVYHRALTVAEIICMVVLFWAGAKREWSQSKVFTTSFMKDWNRYLGWKLGDSMKSTTNFIVVFMSVERTIALWAPLLFDKVNKPPVAIGFILVSWIIGCGQMESSFGFSAEVEHALHRVNNFFQIAGVIAIVVFTAMIVLGLWRAARRHRTLNTASTQWETTKQLCYLQLIVSVFIVFDLTTTVLYDFLTDVLADTRPANGGFDTVRTLNYQQAMYWQWRDEGVAILKVINTAAEVVDQCLHFYLYMVFSRRFREGFLSLFDWNSKKTTRVAPQAIELQASGKWIRGERTKQTIGE